MAHSKEFIQTIWEKDHIVRDNDPKFREKTIVMLGLKDKNTEIDNHNLVRKLTGKNQDKEEVDYCQ